MERTVHEASDRPAISVPLPSAPRILFQLLVVLSVAMSVVSFALKFARFELDVDQTRDAERWLDVDREAAIPAWFASSLLLAAAVATASLNRSAPQSVRSRFWPFLACVLVGLSLDESISVHEEISEQLDQILDIGGPLRYAWVIPGALFAACVALASRGALRKLPRPTARLILLGGCLYVGGAVGLELLDSQLSDASQVPRLASAAEASVEELLEMLGMSVYLFGVLAYLVAAPGASQTRTIRAGKRDATPP